MVRCLIVFLLVIGSSRASAQISKSDQQRCEAILLDAIQTGRQPTLHSVGLCENVPVDRVFDHLESALRSKELSVRLAAAHVCVERSPKQFRKSIIKSMNEIQASFEQKEISSPKSLLKGLRKMRRPSQLEMVQQSAILMSLGDLKAKKTIEAWVNPGLSPVKEKKWICPMMCVHPSQKKGRCAVCAMELVQTQSEGTEDHWEAKLEAIRAYQDFGNPVTDAARSIVISEASPHIRLLAAGIWSKEAPDDAFPHLAIFLHGHDRDFALELLSASMPSRFIKELQAVVHSPEASMPLRLSAYDGLLRSGKSEYLTELRNKIDTLDEKEHDHSGKLLAIFLMVNHAETEDVIRLKRLLDSDEYQILAAKALLTLVEKGALVE